MKKAITTIISAFIMITSFSAFAASNANPLKDVRTAKIMQTYLEAATLGNTEYNKFLFTDDFEFTNTTIEKTFNKSEYMKFLKQNRNLIYNCTNSYEILDESGQACVAKVTMEFENFTRVDFITMCHGEQGWKISKVISTYPES